MCIYIYIYIHIFIYLFIYILHGGKHYSIYVVFHHRQVKYYLQACPQDN